MLCWCGESDSLRLGQDVPGAAVSLYHQLLRGVDTFRHSISCSPVGEGGRDVFSQVLGLDVAATDFDRCLM